MTNAQWSSQQPGPREKALGHIVVTLRVYREGKFFVGHCDELDVSSFGSTLDEAIAATMDATVALLDALEEEGVEERDRIFTERGITFYSKAPSDKLDVDVVAHPGEVVTPQRVSVLVGSQHVAVAQLPLVSSKQVLAALEREGFAKSGVARGSHRVMKKRTPTGTLMEPVPLDRRELPRGTLTSILRRAGISRTRFLVLLGGRSAQPQPAIAAPRRRQGPQGSSSASADADDIALPAHEDAISALGQDTIGSELTVPPLGCGPRSTT